MSEEKVQLRATDLDAPLMQRAMGGDYEAFEELVNRHERGIYTLAKRIVTREQDAEDVVQQTFLSVVEHIQNFRQDAAFKTWLFHIATNHALKVLRKRRGLVTVPLETVGRGDEEMPLPHPDYIARWDQDPQKLAQDNEVQAILQGALETLEEKYRLVFVLRDVEGFSTEEAAEALGISVANAKVRLMRARLMLREILTRQLGDPSTKLVGGHHDHGSENVTLGKGHGSNSQETL